MVLARDSDDFIRTFCHQIHFFASSVEGEPWIAEHKDAFRSPTSAAHLSAALAVSLQRV